MPEVKLVIDGEEIILQKERTVKGYDKFGAPEPYDVMAVGEAPLIASVYIREGLEAITGEGGWLGKDSEAGPMSVQNCIKVMHSDVIRFKVVQFSSWVCLGSFAVQI